MLGLNLDAGIILLWGTAGPKAQNTKMSGEEGIDGKLICLEIKYIVGTVEADCLIVRQENKKKALDLALDF